MPLRFYSACRCIRSEDFGLRCAVADIHSRVQTPVTCKTSGDSDGSLYIARGHDSVGDSAIRNHSDSGNHARQD